MFYRAHFKLLMLLCLAGGIAGLIPASPIQAQTVAPLNWNDSSKTELDLSFSPPVTYLSVKPGESKAIELKLKNSGSRNLAVQLELADFESDGTTGQPKLKFNSTFPYLKAHEAAWDWHQPQVVKSGETADIWLEVTLPKSVPAKEYHLTILARGSQIGADATGASVGSNGQVAGLIGSNLILAVTDSEINLSRLDLHNWQVPSFVDSLRGIDVSGLVRNQGQHAGPILGKASLSGPNGQLLKSWLFYPDMVLPGSTRKVRVLDITNDPTADPSLWLNQPNLSLTSDLSYQPSWLLGSYSLKIQLYHNDYTDASITTTQTFRIIVLPFGIMIVLISLPLVYWLVVTIRNRIDKQLDRR